MRNCIWRPQNSTKGTEAVFNAIQHIFRIAAVIQILPPKWKRPLGRLSHTWLRAVEADLGQLNTGLGLFGKLATEKTPYVSYKTNQQTIQPVLRSVSTDSEPRGPSWYADSCEASVGILPARSHDVKNSQYWSDRLAKYPFLQKRWWQR